MKMSNNISRNDAMLTAYKSDTFLSDHPRLLVDIPFDIFVYFNPIVYVHGLVRHGLRRYIKKNAQELPECH